MKKSLALAIIIALLLPLMAGCGNQQAQKGEAVHLIWYAANTPNTPSKDSEAVMQKVNEYLKEKINCTVELRVLPFADYETKIKNATMAGEDWDIGATCFWMLDYAKNARKGFFYPLNDLLAKYGQGITGSLKKMPEYIDAVKINGEAYALPIIYGGSIQQGLFVKKSDLEKYGFDLQSVKKLQDAYPLFDKAKKGKPGVIPLFYSWNYNGAGLYDFAVDATLPGAVRFDDPSAKVFNQYADPGYIHDIIDVWRELYTRGYTPRESYTQTGDEFRGGKIFSLIGMYNKYSAAEWSDDGSPKVAIDAVPLYPPIATSTVICQGNMMAINAQSKHPEEAMKFLNLLYSDAYLMNLLTYGIEGRNYEKTDKDTIRKLNDDYTCYIPFGNHFLNYLTPNLPKDIWQEYINAGDNAKMSPLFGFIADTDPVRNEITAMTNILTEYTSSLSLGASDPKKVLPEMNARLKTAGLDKYLAEMQRQVDEWKKTKNK